MKKIKTALGLAVCAMTALSALPMSATADSAVVYGTMNIPYAEFYKAELADSNNPYEVDAVTSATKSKWCANQEGGLAAGTYHSEANENGGGQILGVTYPVAISQEDLNALGADNYGFTALDSKPAAYKNVTVSGGEASFSKIIEDSVKSYSNVDFTVITDTRYGDYQLTPSNLVGDGLPIGSKDVVYGAVVKTALGNSYGLRTLENIWRNGQLAWSVGVKTVEGHGNALSYENFTTLNGSTISEIDYITASGYVRVNTNTYLPVKLDTTLSVENGAAPAGTVAYSLSSALPESYKAVYSANIEGSTAADGVLTYSGAQPGTYTFTLSDSANAYESKSATFILSTADMPAAYDSTDKKLVAANGFTAEQLANFIKNITSVSVDGTSYAATGKRPVKIIGEDGAIDLSAQSSNANIFAEGKESFEVEVTATGYTNTLKFTLSLAAAAPSSSETVSSSSLAPSSVNESSSSSSSSAASSSSSAASSSSKASSAAAKTSSTAGANTNNPSTGAGAGTAVAGAAVLAAAVITASKKKTRR